MPLRPPSLLRSVAFAALAPLLLGGCIAKTALDVATAPVKVGAKAVDLATTSQSEADEKRGREIRKRDEKLAKLEKRLQKQDAQCLDGNDMACRNSVETRRDIEALRAPLPAVRD
jgi:hypothetical protein